MLIIVTKNGVCLSASDKASADYLVKDDDFLKLVKKPGLCLSLLRDSDIVTIGRLGKEISPSTFNYNPNNQVKLDNLTFKKEVGYYAKL